MAEVDERVSYWDYFSCIFFMIFSAKEVKYIHPFNQTRGCLFQLPRRPLFIIYISKETFIFMQFFLGLIVQVFKRIILFFCHCSSARNIALCQLQKCFQLLIKIHQIKITSQQCKTSNVGEAKATHTIQKYVCNDLQHNQNYCLCHYYCYS